MSNTFQLEPFWNDLFVLQVHAQIAAWALGGNQPDRYVFFAAVPSFTEITVAQLDACARGYQPYGVDQCVKTYATTTVTAANGTVYGGVKGSLTLTPSEAKNLLSLDPFYSGGGQAANLNTTRAAPIAGQTYGASIGQLPQQYAHAFNNTVTAQNTTDAQSTTTLNVTSVEGFDSSVGASLNVSFATGAQNPEAGTSPPTFGVTENLNVGNGIKETIGGTVKTTFHNSTAVSNQLATQINVTLNDVDNTTLGPLECKECHDPLAAQPSVNIFLDKIFGSFMFQDPFAPPPPGGELSSCCVALVRALAHQEQAIARFSDVPAGLALAGKIGLLARFNVLPGVASSMFQPAAPLTTSQLDAAIAVLSHPTTVMGRTPIRSRPLLAPTTPTANSLPEAEGVATLAAPNAPVVGVPEQSSRGVTREAFAVAVGKAFGLQSSTVVRVSDTSSISPAAAEAVISAVAKGYLTVDSGSAVHPGEILTREEAATALFLVFRDHALAN